MRSKSTFPAVVLSVSVRGWQSTWFYCKDQPTPGQSTGLLPFSIERVKKPSPLKVTPAEKVEVNMLVERVVQLVRDGVTGVDLLEVFLSRRIQPLQPVIIQCGCTRVLVTTLGSTRRKLTRRRWCSGCRASLATRTTPGGLGGFLHSTTPTNQTRSTLRCIRCPTESRSRRERRAGVTVVTEILTEDETRRVKTRAVVWRSTLHLARKELQAEVGPSKCSWQSYSTDRTDLKAHWNIFSCAD